MLMSIFPSVSSKIPEETPVSLAWVLCPSVNYFVLGKGVGFLLSQVISLFWEGLLWKGKGSPKEGEWEGKGMSTLSEHGGMYPKS